MLPILQPLPTPGERVIDDDIQAPDKARQAQVTTQLALVVTHELQMLVYVDPEHIRHPGAKINESSVSLSKNIA